MSKASDIQETPQAIFDELDSTYHFIFDVCANASNHKTPRWYGPGGVVDDAFSVSWPLDGWLWMNPPYSRGEQQKWVNKAMREADGGCQVLALLPADTSTKLFHILYEHYPVTFLKQRLKFNGANNSAKFGSMLVEIT